ncbi:hypothetical protein K0M31_007632 [Melipona bicolor]|uniref:Uncharacterized protein n=1 Tax=Melipona bicolor TaxID=60889 RepID=A0AA40KVZ4_9HYME|nr:hypothetical protein K0M31_007632 [Melipona bicolor]
MGRQQQQQQQQVVPGKETQRREEENERGASRGTVCVPFAFETGAPLSASCSSDKAARLASPNRLYVPRANAQRGTGRTVLENRRYFELLQPPERQSYGDLLGLISRREVFCSKDVKVLLLLKI